jgi:hypothetical protein
LGWAGRLSDNQDSEQQKPQPCEEAASTALMASPLA